MSEKLYKVWIELEVEEINDNGEDHYYNMDLPFASTKVFDNEEDALMFASALHEWGQKEGE